MPSLYLLEEPSSASATVKRVQPIFSELFRRGLWIVIYSQVKVFTSTNFGLPKKPPWTHCDKNETSKNETWYERVLWGVRTVHLSIANLIQNKADLQSSKRRENASTGSSMMCLQKQPSPIRMDWLTIHFTCCFNMLVNKTAGNMKMNPGQSKTMVIAAGSWSLPHRPP